MLPVGTKPMTQTGKFRVWQMLSYASLLLLRSGIKLIAWSWKKRPTSILFILYSKNVSHQATAQRHCLRRARKYRLRRLPPADAMLWVTCYTHYKELSAVFFFADKTHLCCSSILCMGENILAIVENKWDTWNKSGNDLDIFQERCASRPGYVFKVLIAQCRSETMRICSGWPIPEYRDSGQC